jgi:hypothetical protein
MEVQCITARVNDVTNGISRAAAFQTAAALFQPFLTAAED